MSGKDARCKLMECNGSLFEFFSVHIFVLQYGAIDELFIFLVKQIHMVRDPEDQINIGVPEEYLSGHAFHVYNLTSPDKT